MDYNRTIKQYKFAVKHIEDAQISIQLDSNIQRLGIYFSNREFSKEFEEKKLTFGNLSFEVARWEREYSFSIFDKIEFLTNLSKYFVDQNYWSLDGRHTDIGLGKLLLDIDIVKKKVKEAISNELQYIKNELLDYLNIIDSKINLIGDISSERKPIIDRIDKEIKSIDKELIDIKVGSKTYIEKTNKINELKKAKQLLLQKVK